MAAATVMSVRRFASVCILSEDGQNNFMQGLVCDGHFTTSHAVRTVELRLKLAEAAPEEKIAIARGANSAGSVTPDMLAMAMAVLQGDAVAALQLADRVTEAYGR
jgi:hypothetical protein